jgi:hypothetical protein
MRYRLVQMAASGFNMKGRIAREWPLTEFADDTSGASVDPNVCCPDVLWRTGRRFVCEYDAATTTNPRRKR